MWLSHFVKFLLALSFMSKHSPGRDPAQKPLKIWAVWAVFQQDLSGLTGLGGLGGFFGKTAQTAQILLKKPLKNRSFLAVIFERFFKQDLSGFWAVFPGRGPRLPPPPPQLTVFQARFERFLSGLPGSRSQTPPLPPPPAHSNSLKATPLCFPR